MERFKIYKYDELVNLVMEKIKLEEEKIQEYQIRLLTKQMYYLFFTREETIKEVGQILL